MSDTPRIVYCHCQYAQVLPKDTKEAVLQHLCETGRPFEAVADLCELSARRDPLLRELAQGGPLKIAACYPRAVKWLFSAANAALDPAATQVCNLRVETAPEVIQTLTQEGIHPNVPVGKSAPSDAPQSLNS
jgi:hypothetical protein